MIAKLAARITLQREYRERLITKVAIPSTSGEELPTPPPYSVIWNLVESDPEKWC